jgi:hypothetical protein
MKQLFSIFAILALAAYAQAQTTRQTVTTNGNGTLVAPTNFWAANSIALANALAANPNVRVVRRVESEDVLNGGIVFYSGPDGQLNLGSSSHTGTIINAGPGLIEIFDTDLDSQDIVLPGATVSYSWASDDEDYISPDRWTPARLPISNGLIVRTSPIETAARTITGTAGQITVTNGNGTAGNPTISLPSTITGNRTFADNLTVQGNTALGDSASDTLTISGTITAANANGTAAGSIANVGTHKQIDLDRWLTQQIVEISTFPGAWRSAVAGGGIFRNATEVPQILVLRTTATTGSSAVISTSGTQNTGIYGQLIAAGSDVRYLNFSRPFSIAVFLSEFGSSSGTEDTFRFGLGYDGSFSATPRALSSRGIGFRINNQQIYGAVHNGTTLTETASFGTITNRQVCRVLITSDGAGNVTFRLNSGTPVTTSGGPTGNTASTIYNMEMGITNGAGTTDYSVAIPRIRMAFLD